MRVGVNETGQDVSALEIDSLCARWRRPRADRNDVATFEHNGGPGSHIAGTNVNDVGVKECELRLRQGLALTRKSQGQQQRRQFRTLRAFQLSCSSER